MLDVKVPDLPESVEEATLMAWHKHQGDAVHRDEKLADIETDKIVLEVSAEQDGVLAEVIAQEGQTIRRGDLIAKLEPGASGAPAQESPKEETKPEPPQQESKPEPAAAAPEPAPQREEPAAPAPATTPTESEVHADVGPAVRKLIAEHNIDVSQLEGTGRGGRITKADVVRHIDSSPIVTTKFGSEEKIAAPKPAQKATPDRPGERRVPMTRLRARVAERLVEAQQTAAMLTTFNEVNMKPVMDLRNRYKDKFATEYGVKLGFMSFFVKACVEGLKNFPAVNASVDGTDILYHEYFDIGIAVSSPRGLVVPIVRNADQLSFAEIESQILDYGNRAKESQLTLEELTGGTFTISNGGIFGSLMSTPILNPPQSAILGMHKIQERPMVVDGQIVILPMMYLALTYDHRIIDGREAVQFLVAVKEALEEPARLLLQV